MNNITKKNKNLKIMYEYVNGRLSEITFWDLTDINDKTGYTKSKRGLKNVLNDINGIWSEQTTFKDIINILDKNSMKYRTYYGLD